MTYANQRILNNKIIVLVSLCLLVATPYVSELLTPDEIRYYFTEGEKLCFPYPKTLSVCVNLNEWIDYGSNHMGVNR